MALILGISDWMIPLIMIGIIVYGLLKEVDVFEAFVEGATDGVKVVMNILPTLIGLLMAVSMLRTSGALTGLSKLIAPLLSFSHFPADAIPVVLLRSFSSSAATGLIIDVFKTHGPDSFIGRLVSVMFGCTETIFYTMSVYLMTVKVNKSRYILPGALLASLVGVIASYWLVLKFFGI